MTTNNYRIYSKMMVIFINILLFFYCCHQYGNKDFSLPIKFYDKSETKISDVILFKGIDSLLSRNDLYKINQFKNNEKCILFIPDSVKMDVFNTPTPFSPETIINLYICNSDSVQLYLTNEKVKEKNLYIYEGYLSSGLYLLKIMSINIESGLYTLQCNSEKRELFFIK